MAKSSRFTISMNLKMTWWVISLTKVHAILNPLLLPDIWLPMDVIDNGTLKGRELDAALYGSPELVPGVFGNGLKLNMEETTEQDANFGNLRDTCLGNPERCTAGFTLSVWLQLGTRRGDTSYIISSGGQTVYSFGIVLYERDEKLNFALKTQQYEWQTDGSITSYSGQWFHVMLTWEIGSGIKMYFNGDLVGEDATSSTTSVASNQYNDLVLGKANRQSAWGRRGVCLVDDLRFWNHVLNSTQATLLATEGLHRLNMSAIPLNTNGTFAYISNDAYDISTCGELHTQGHGRKTSFIEVIADHATDFFGMETMTFKMAGGTRQDYVKMYVMALPQRECGLLFYRCTLLSRQLSGVLWTSTYQCSCPTRDCSRLFLDLKSARDDCDLNWSSCQPVLVCDVSLESP